MVTVHDVIETQGSPWLIMELVPSRSLAQVLAEDGPLSPACAAAMGMTLLEALGSAHAAGVVHRDVKPGNILVTPEGRVGSVSPILRRQPDACLRLHARRLAPF